MKSILLTICIVLIPLLQVSTAVDNGAEVQDLANFIAKTQEVTGNRWTTTFSANNKVLFFTSKQTFRGKLKALQAEQGTEGNHPVSFALVVSEKVAPERWLSQKQEMNSKVQTFRKLASEMLPRVGALQLQELEFQPNSLDEWKLYLTYVKSKHELEVFPEYWYGQIGLKTIEFAISVLPSDPRNPDYLRLNDDKLVIMSLLSKYK